MGEKKILTEDMIDEKLEAAKSREVRWIDPYKMAFWTLEFSLEMVGGGVSRSTVEQWIEDKLITAYKPGKQICFVPADFVTCFKRFKRQ